MKEIGYYNPVKIISGTGCVKNYEGFADFGAKCLIVCSRSAARLSGALDDTRAALDSCGVSYAVFDKVEPNPSVETCHAAGAMARDFRADFIVGIGGGSPLDAAKAVAVFASNPRLEGEDVYRLSFDAPPLPILAIGTTAGTGSEVTQYAVLSVRSIQTKKSLADDSLFPKIAFLDPDYTNTLPYPATASTAVDALCHAIEGYFSRRANDVTDALAERAISLVGGGICELSRGAIDSELRANLLYGSTVAGMVIAGTGTGFVHAMGYPLTYFDGVAHGAANAYFIADFLELMSLACAEREERIYKLMGISDIREFRELIAKIIPLSVRLSREKIQSYTKGVCKSKHLTSSIFEVSENDIYDLYKQYAE
ncbi:MAG: iron-containing alcohol dehydrogenase family protein [Clostridia bacterium]